jgi:hypothetical protein
MTPTETPRLAQLLAVLAEAFGEPVSELRAEAYFLALEDVPMDALERVGRQALNLRFFPRPADLRRLVEGSSEHAAELAWLGVLREVRRVGYTGEPELEAATLETIQGLWGSWARLCQTLPGEGPELLGWAKQFRGSYGATRERLERPELIGRTEATALLADITQRAKALGR